MWNQSITKIVPPPSQWSSTRWIETNISKIFSYICYRQDTTIKSIQTQMWLQECTHTDESIIILTVTSISWYLGYHFHRQTTWYTDLLKCCCGTVPWNRQIKKVGPPNSCWSKIQWNETGILNLSLTFVVGNTIQAT